MTCVAYKGADVYVCDNVYEPAEDSFLLADACLNYINESSLVLEVGTGSGFISSVISANINNVSVIGSDISPLALACARKNGIEVVRSDLFGAFRNHVFDTIVFNPPYLPTADDERLGGWLNYAFDGGADGRATIRAFLSRVRNYLKPGGDILILVSSLTGPQEVIRRMEEAGFNTGIEGEEQCFFEKLMVLHGTATD